MYSKTILLSLILILACGVISTEANTPKIHNIFLTSGISYDDLEEINSFFQENAQSIIKQQYLNYLGFHYSSNFIPFIYEKPANIFYSFELRLPFSRKNYMGGNYIDLKTYSAFFEINAFESYTKPVTVYPIIGFGINFVNMKTGFNTITIPSDENIIEEKFIEELYSKFTYSINIGGGMNIRYSFQNDKNETNNLIIGFNVRYSIPLEILNIYNSDWKRAGKTVQNMPEYFSSGLSLELQIGFEFQNKKVYPPDER